MFLLCAEINWNNLKCSVNQTICLCKMYGIGQKMEIDENSKIVSFVLIAVYTCLVSLLPLSRNIYQIQIL